MRPWPASCSGVTGGIAAYKACEVCRLLVRGGHDVVPLLTPGAERFVTAETFRALARRPPGDDVYLHLTRADLLVVDALHREHAREARARPRRQRAHRGGARAPRPGARRAGDEPAHVGAPRHPRERRDPARPRRRSSSAPTRARPPRASSAWGGWPSPPRSSVPREELLAGTGPLAGKRVLVSAGGTREPLDAVRFLGNRSSGPDGRRARRRGAPPRRPRHAARREPRRARAGRGRASSRPRRPPTSRARRSRSPPRPTSS